MQMDVYKVVIHPSLAISCRDLTFRNCERCYRMAVTRISFIRLLRRKPTTNPTVTAKIVWKAGNCVSAWAVVNARKRYYA